MNRTSAPRVPLRASRAARLLVAAAVMLGLAASPTAAESSALVPVNAVVSPPAAQFYGYAAPVVVTEKGGQITYMNLDIAQHDVVQDPKADRIAGPRKKPWCKAFRRKACPVFWTRRIGIGQQTKVLGLGAVKPGKTYSFYCTLHPGMRGTLIVRP
jgi:plastocyanin